MRSLPLLILILTFSLFAEKKDSEHLKSRVYFYKNVSEEELKGWEKDFFKDYFEDQPMSVPDIDNIADDETEDADIIAENIKPQKKKKKTISSGQLKKVPLKKAPIKEVEIEIPDEVEPVPEVEKAGKPQITIKPVKEKKPVSLNERPETSEKDNETPDSEVDRSSRIRKMKKLLKKRKGKRRIDKRF